MPGKLKDRLYYNEPGKHVPHMAYSKHCVVLPAMPVKVPQNKQSTFLAAKQAAAALESWRFLAFEGAIVDPKAFLDSADLECGAFELLWRCLPPSTVFVPVSLAALVSQSQQPLERAKAYIEHSGVLATLNALARRATCLLVPIFCDLHWTLLVLTRRAADQVVPPLVGDGRQEAENLVCDQMQRPLIKEASSWEVSYYDTLRELKPSCKEQAQLFLRALKIEQPIGKVGNLVFQDDDTCGWWVLHFMEEHCRRQRGEAKWSQHFELHRRVQLVDKMRERLGVAEKERQKEAAMLLKGQKKNK